MRWVLLQWDLRVNDWREIASSKDERIGTWLFTHRVAAYPLATIRLISTDEDDYTEVVAYYRSDSRG